MHSQCTCVSSLSMTFMSKPSFRQGQHGRAGFQGAATKLKLTIPGPGGAQQAYRRLGALSRQSGALYWPVDIRLPAGWIRFLAGIGYVLLPMGISGCYAGFLHPALQRHKPITLRTNGGSVAENQSAACDCYVSFSGNDNNLSLRHTRTRLIALA
jgi:hypothetical protein